MKKAITKEQALEEISKMSEIAPVIGEMFSLYSKWRKYYKELGISTNSGHKKACSIVIRDYGDKFNSEVLDKGLESFLFL